MKNHRFGRKKQVFEETTMFRRFGQLFSKKLQKVAHFVKKDEKSKNFGEMLQLLEQTIMFWSTFQQKVAKCG